MTRRERVGPYVVAAFGLAAAGAALSIWRPLAPPTGAVSSDLLTFSPQVLELIESYRAPRRAAVVTSTALSIAVPAAAVLTARGRRAIARLAGPHAHAPARAAAVAAAVMVVVDLARLPLDITFGYFQDGAWGFRTADALAWSRDWLVSRAPGWLVVAAASAGLAGAIVRWPASWHWRAVVAGTGLGAVLVLAAPVVLEPLWMRTVPLEAGETRESVQTVLARAGEEQLPVLVGDASRRTTRVNAYVSGLGPTRRVVLFDTLLELPPDEVAAVVAHELAHRQHRDIPRGVLLGATGLLPAALLLRWAVHPDRGGRLVGARGSADPRLVAVAIAVVSVLATIGQPAGLAASRRAEASADHRALELTRDPATTVRLKRGFVVSQLSDPDPPTWAVLAFATHPPSGERIAAAIAFAEREGLPLPTREELAEAERDAAHPGPR
jgi:STE24 endopeptidase